MATRPWITIHLTGIRNMLLDLRSNYTKDALNIRKQCGRLNYKWQTSINSNPAVAIFNVRTAKVSIGATKVINPKQRRQEMICVLLASISSQKFLKEF